VRIPESPELLLPRSHPARLPRALSVVEIAPPSHQPSAENAKRRPAGAPSPTGRRRSRSSPPRRWVATRSWRRDARPSSTCQGGRADRRCSSGGERGGRAGELESWRAGELESWRADRRCSSGGEGASVRIPESPKSLAPRSHRARPPRALSVAQITPPSHRPSAENAKRRPAGAPSPTGRRRSRSSPPRRWVATRSSRRGARPSSTCPPGSSRSCRASTARATRDTRGATP